MDINAHKQQALLVFGMHRSGTSATARVLNLLGATLNPELLEASFDNPKGFWESAEAVNIHERFFAGLSRTWYDMQKLPDGWNFHPAARQAVSEIVDLVKRDFRGAALWIAKDPRMCLVAPLWLEALAALDIKVKSLFVVRNPIEVTESLNTRHRRVQNDWAIGHGPVMWAQYLVEAEVATRGGCRAMMTYDELLTDWRKAMSRISREMDIAWPNSIDEVGPSIDAFLDKSDRHHKAELSNVNLYDMPDIVLRMYEKCLLIAQQAGSWESLQPLVEQFQAASDLYSGALGNVMRHYRDCQAAVQEKTAQVVHGEDVRQQMETTIEAYRLQAKKYDDLLRAANTRIESLGQSNAALLESTNAQIAALNDELSAYRKQAEVYEERLGVADAKIESLSRNNEALVESTNGKIAALSNEISAHRNQAEIYEERLRSANAMNVSLLANYEGMVDSTSATIADFERQLQAYKEQALTYDQQLREANGRVFHLTQQIQVLQGQSSP